MTTVARKPGRMADVMSWLDESGLALKGGFGLLRDLRIEDFVEEGEYVLRAEVPGVDPDKDLEVFVEGNTLVVQGERREEQRDKEHRELHYGSFERAVRLPDGADEAKVSATYEDGVLEVRVPISAEAAAAPRHKVAVGRRDK